MKIKDSLVMQCHPAKIVLVIQATQELRLNLIHSTLEVDGLSK